MERDKYSEDEVEEDEDSKMEETSSKRMEGGSSQQRSCQVDSCTTNLNYVKPYHRRHKVCEFHAKAASVVLQGSQQRFCQQCSRFHALSEFDDSKRSCRRRLAGHNERRRKSTYES